MKKILLLSLFLTACASTPEDYENEIDELHKQIRQLKRERDAAREDYDADVSRAFRRDQLDRRFPYSGMPDAPDWQKRRSREADEAEYNALLHEQRMYEQKRTRFIKTQPTTMHTPTGLAPVVEGERAPDESCVARPVYTVGGKIINYRRICHGMDQ
jgi:hypothetical protein